jgi:hypothetical protein
VQGVTKAVTPCFGVLMKKQKKKKIQQVEKEQLITILRRPSGLSALINRPKYPFTMSLYLPTINNTFDELDNFFESIEMPLHDVPDRLLPEKRSLLQDWKKLQDHPNSENACVSQLRLLLKTQEAADLKASEKESAFLFSSKDRNRQFVEMRSMWIEAAKAIGVEHIFFVFERSCDPHWKHNYPGIVKIPKLPPLFKTFVLPLLQRDSAMAIPEWISLYRALDLERYQNLLHSISRMLKLGQEVFVRQWCMKLLSCPPNRRGVTGSLIVQTKLYEHNPAKLSENIFAEFFSICLKRNIPSRLLYLIEAIKRNIQPEFLFDGFKLANRFCPEYHFETFNHVQPFQKDTAITLANNVRSTFRRKNEFILLLWEECGKKTGFQELMTNPIWKKIGSKATYYLLHFIADRLYSYASPKQWEKYRTLSSTVFPEVFETLENQIPRKYRLKFCKCFGYLGWELSGIKEFLQYIPLMTRAVKRICKSPFGLETKGIDVLLNFVKDSKRLWNAFLSAPDSSFLVLEKSCSSRNHAALIERGIRNLLRIAPLFTIKCFRHFPGKLFSVARLIGTMDSAERIRSIHAFMRSPAGAQKFCGMDLKHACESIKEHLTPEVSSPIPKALTKYVNGEYSLSAVRQKRYRRLLFENFNLTRLELLENFVLQYLRKPFSHDTTTPGLDHAMQLMQGIRENRRQFKRFLHAFFQGKGKYIFDHPKTLQWIQDHPKIDQAVWHNGIEVSENLIEHGTVTVQIESNPFEVLKMGTYVGSCLAIGGWYSFSAVSVLLDANKQVLYARNESGAVIARQLLAISDDNKLVCFDVYPVGISKAVKRLFRKYDHRFAKELKIDFSSSKYSVCNILSQDWYDDSVWNLKD